MFTIKKNSMEALSIKEKTWLEEARLLSRQKEMMSELNSIRHFKEKVGKGCPVTGISLLLKMKRMSLWTRFELSETAMTRIMEIVMGDLDKRERDRERRLDKIGNMLNDIKKEELSWQD